MAQAPEWALTDDESKRMAEALSEVTRHYPLPVINPAHMSLVALAIVCASIYAPRVVITINRVKGGKPREKPAQAAPVGQNNNPLFNWQPGQPAHAA